MILSFHPCFSADVQIILGDRAPDPEIQRLIDEAGAIILPQGVSRGLYEACVESGAQVFPDYHLRFSCPGKIGQERLFSRFGTPHPRTRCWPSVAAFREALRLEGAFPHPFPFVVKDTLRHEGAGVWVADDEAALQEALERITAWENPVARGFVTQEFIEAGGNVLRAVVAFRRVITFWKRPRREGQRITTVSRNAHIDFTWKPELQERATERVAAFAARTGINLAAVDLLYPRATKDPEPLFLEINFFFGRRALGGTQRYYRLLHETVCEWLTAKGFDAGEVRLV